MRLSDLLQFNDIVVQCHNNPDADAIASGFGVYTYLKNNDKNVHLVYGGPNKIQKSNLCLMVETLKIPIEHVESLNNPELLITVDCQYGEGNVQKFEAQNIAVIDHHQISGELPELQVVRSNIGACSTIVWDMLRAEGMDVSADRKLATSLYYGLLSDTNNFTEVSHPLDKDLRDETIFDKALVTRFRNTNLSLRELVIAGKALIDYQYNDEYRFSVVQAEPCDPNILGMISDLVLEVDVVDTCVVYSILPSGIKLSVRSCIKEVKASELVQVITEGIGSGGGHLIKAGGFIKKDKLTCPMEEISRLFIKRMKDYFEDTEIIYASKYVTDLSDMKLYRKESISIGFVKGTDMFSAGTQVNVRTLEGDLNVSIEDDTHIMIGICNEVYPIKKEKLDRSYITTDEAYVFEGEYEPTIKESIEGLAISIIPYAKKCIATGGVLIYAKPLDHRVKVFTQWDRENYMLGRKGDYLAVRKDDLHDVYIIDGKIFDDIYSEV